MTTNQAGGLMTRKQIALAMADTLHAIADEMIEDANDGEEDTETTLASVVEGYYGNQMDELHDSSGDDDYQDDILVEMAIIELLIEQAKGLDAIHRYTTEEKRMDAPHYKEPSDAS